MEFGGGEAREVVLAVFWPARRICTPHPAPGALYQASPPMGASVERGVYYVSAAENARASGAAQE